MRYFIICFFLLSAVAVDAQVTAPDSKIPPAVSGVLNFPKQFFFIDLTQNSWLNKPDGVKTKWISGGVNVNFLYEFFLVHSWLGIAPGLSYSVSGVKTNALYDYQYDNDLNLIYTDLMVLPDSVYQKSKLSTSYMDIPLEIHFHTKPTGGKRKSFLIAPGFRAGILVGDFWKLKPITQLMQPDKVKVYDIEHLSAFHYGVSLRLMYYKFGLYGYYSLNKLFEKDKGPAITPVSVGITLSPF